MSLARGLVVALAVAAPLGLAVAESPEPPKKSAKGHPNLSAAQKLVSQAVDKIEAAQKANEYDLGGHAAKAKALLQQAKAEIDLAAQAAGKPDKR